MEKTIEIIAHRCGDGWEANRDGHVWQLPYYVKKRSDVIKYFDDRYGFWGAAVRVVFAK